MSDHFILWRLVWLAIGAIIFSQQTAATLCRGNVQIGPDVTSISSYNYPSTPYPAYTFCRLHITGPADKFLRLTFTDFDIEEGSADTCSNDFFTVYDTSRPGLQETIAAQPVCQSESGQYGHPERIPTTIGPLCGKKTVSPQVMKGNTAVIQFCSDRSVASTGWKIEIDYLDALPSPPEWKTPTLLLTALRLEHIIISPNFPLNYYDDYTATWIIKNEHPVKDSAVLIQSFIFNLHDTDTACDDRIVIRDVTNNVDKTFCSNGFRTLEIPNSQEIHIIFTTNKYDTGPGFKIQISFVRCPSGRGLLECDDGDGCYAASQGCDGTPQCDDNSDELPKYCAPECGVAHIPWRNDTTNSRIFGGITARRHSLPWQAAMIREWTFGGSVRRQQFCGGTIISDQWILTAAHCFEDLSNYNFSVRVGGQMLSATPDLDGAVEIAVEKFKCHPYYIGRATFWDYDFCLLKLEKKITFRKNIAPACLPRFDAEIVGGTECLVSGWGATDTLETVPSNPNVAPAGPDELLQVPVEIIEPAACIAAHGEFEGSVTPRMMCAGPEKGGKGFCGGDSGGPLVCPSSSNRWTVNGIVSWSARPCASPVYGGVYAKTSKATRWITDTMILN